ncbi:MAG: transporter substrate-binding domain-containing protein [Gammaproteobacteria bacterium]|nr:transporter substrate-binding domain-containing protein [Gammaproteobacteria bacterium]
MLFSRAMLLVLLSMATTVFAGERITVSTNNTPLDREVLLAVSREALGRLDVSFELINLPSERSLRSADQGEIDGEGLRVAGLSKIYPNLVQVPEPFVKIKFVAFAKDATIDLSGWDSLKLYRIAFINGWKMFEKNAANGKVVNKVDTPEQMFKMLELGRIDLALYTLADGEAFTRANGMPSIAALEPALKSVDLYLYLHKRHAQLVPRVAAAIRDMKADGTYNTILAEVLKR